MFEKIFIRYPFLRYVSAILIMAILFFLSSKPGDDLPSFAIGMDKIAHVIAYAVLGVAFAFWFRPSLWKKKSILISFIVVLLTTFYGVLDEFHQSFTPNRFVSGFDLLADAIGGILAVIFYRIYLRQVFFKNHPKR